MDEINLKTVRSAKVSATKVTDRNGQTANTRDTTLRREVTVLRKMMVLAVIGSVLLNTLISVIAGINVYHVTIAKMKEKMPDSGKQDQHEIHPATLGLQTDMNRCTEIQKNHSDALGNLTEMNRRTDEKVHLLYEMQNNHSDALDNLTEINRQTDEKMNVLSEIQKNHSDTHGQLTELNLRLNETEEAVQKLQSQLNSLESNLTACTACQGGWTLHRGSCYSTNETSRNFTDAVTYCEDRGAYLVEIETDAENSFVKNYSSRHSFWIGMTYTVLEDVWTWYHSGNRVQFTDWTSGEPSHYDTRNNAEHCVHMKIQTILGWNDQRCSYSERPLCEKRCTPSIG